MESQGRIIMQVGKEGRIGLVSTVVSIAATAGTSIFQFSHPSKNYRTISKWLTGGPVGFFSAFLHISSSLFSK